ncbi:MAG: hypothetical protein WDO24_26580 [Pseudomonadota bacterium]
MLDQALRGARITDLVGDQTQQMARVRVIRIVGGDFLTGAIRQREIAALILRERYRESSLRSFPRHHKNQPSLLEHGARCGWKRLPGRALLCVTRAHG